MKFSKPIIYTVCLLQGVSAFAATPVTPAKPAAAKPVEAAKSVAPATPILRISAIDGVANPNHKKEIKRYPGKKISFAADLFVKENGKLVAQKASPQDFVWRLTNTDRDCDPARAASCKGSGLEVTKTGVVLHLTDEMFSGLDWLPGVEAKKESLSLKVSSAKDKKLSDSVIILDLADIENQAELQKALDELHEQQNSGLRGFLNNFFSGSSSGNTEEEPAPSYTPSPSYSDDCSPYDATPSCPGRDDRRSGGRDHNRFNRDDRNFPSAPSYQSPVPSFGRDRNGDGRHDRNNIGGGRGNWNRPAPAAPAPYVAPSPAPVVVAPAPASTPGGHFGGGRDRDGDGQPDRRGGGGRPGSSANSPSAPVPAAPGLPSGPGWKPVRQM
ncbi:MAG: hypothetical protein AB7K68_01645 [Bacteriovoracia bacterium]